MGLLPGFMSQDVETPKRHPSVISTTVGPDRALFKFSKRFEIYASGAPQTDRPRTRTFEASRLNPRFLLGLLRRSRVLQQYGTRRFFARSPPIEPGFKAQGLG